MYPDKCPKCDHQLVEASDNCPRCGVIFARIAVKQPVTPPEQLTEGFVSDVLLSAKQGETALVLAVRFGFLLLLVIYGCKLIFTSIEAFPYSGWLLHAVNLVFHEAGHIFFSPFGRFIHVLGGTLGQLIIPSVVIGTFIWQRDMFGAAAGTWWLGESLLDIAPYINDARAGQLMLLGGVTGSEVEDYHDWEVLLTRLGMMQHDHLIAKTVFAAGSFIMIAAMLWGGLLVWRGWQARTG